MNDRNHLSDEVLAKIVSEDMFETRETDIETHIADCELCQTKLMSLAADDSWLDQNRDCLSKEVLSQTSLSGESLSFLSDDVQSPAARSKADVHEFERASIDQMLGRMLAASKHPETLGSLNRYEVESIIGIGGMGVVFRGYDHDLQRPVAIKTILPRLANNGTAKQRFAREARAVAAILHPNVISIHDVDESNDIPWFVMPYIAGPSLRELVSENGPLPEREIVRIGLQIASGLAAAHNQGLVHRDIKPANILVDNRVNRVVITDFGLALRQSEDAITQTGNLAGTLSYMSPEQVRGEELDGRSDLFSLGCLLFYLASGEVPFPSDRAFESMHKITSEPHSDVRSLNPEISKTLAETIDKLLAKEPDHRFGSAAELEKFFEELVSWLNQPTKHQLPTVPRKPVSKGRILGAASMAVFTLILCASAFWILYQPTRVPANVFSKEALWEEIKREYEIQSPEEIRDELSVLMKDVDEMSKKLDEPSPYGTSSLSSEASAIERNLRRFGDSLNAWPE